ncbi:hypothetical protein, partial [Paracoccus sp. SY]|uniref:hypothetical protein n=1 Tax=Paracoccus sp. SY TaxID=1330255 RepID=UPI001961E30A
KVVQSRLDREFLHCHLSKTPKQQLQLVTQDIAASITPHVAWVRGSLIRPDRKPASQARSMGFPTSITIKIVKTAGIKYLVNFFLNEFQPKDYRESWGCYSN